MKAGDTVMPFDDNDLKRLKMLIDECYEKKEFVLQSQWTISAIEALVRRLEAAKEVLKTHGGLNGLCLCDYCKAWRKAAGK